MFCYTDQYTEPKTAFCASMLVSTPPRFKTETFKRLRRSEAWVVTMPTIAITDQEEFSDIDFPLKGTRLELVVDFGTEVPEAAYGRFLAQALRSLADRAEAGKASLTELEEGETAPGEIAADAENWRVPDDLHMKSAKAAHRFLVSIASLEERGPAPTLAEVAEKARLSMPPVYRFVDFDTPAGAYISSLVSVSKRGRAKVIDLTPLGRKVASRIRAGSLPS